MLLFILSFPIEHQRSTNSDTHWMAFYSQIYYNIYIQLFYLPDQEDCQTREQAVPWFRLIQSVNVNIKNTINRTSQQTPLMK